MHIPVSETFQLSIRTSDLLVTIPLRTELASHNFEFQAYKLRNALVGKLMNECMPNSNGIMFQVLPIVLTYQLLYIGHKEGTERCSDSCTKIGLSSSTRLENDKSVAYCKLL